MDRVDLDTHAHTVGHPVIATDQRQIVIYMDGASHNHHNISVATENESVPIQLKGSVQEPVKSSICSFGKTRLKFITLYAIFFRDLLYLVMRYLYRYVPFKSMIANI